MTDLNPNNVEEQLIEDIAGFRHDPLGFVLYAFEWGEGSLSDEEGPRDWQREVLSYIGERLKAGEIDVSEAIQIAIASGHGIGKSALVAWLILWALSTFEDTRGIVTANTLNQLKTKTWAELAVWHNRAINSHWFELTATAIYSTEKGHDKTWRIDMVPWNENNTEAFAGLHNKGRRILVIFDESSAIADPIWEVTEGALTDEKTEIIWAAFGNPTRTTGRFRQCFGNLKHRWFGKQIDSRTVKGTNKAQLQKWVDDYGEDSDFVRPRVRGLFPKASSAQFIESDVVFAAQQREAFYQASDPLIMALDVARGGADFCVFRFRRGMDARSIAPIRLPGSEMRDSMRLVSIAMNLVELHKPDAFFYDGTGVGGPVGDRIKQLGYPIFEVQFGSASPDPKYGNLRAYMWNQMREALRAGLAIDKSPILEADLTAPEYWHNAKDQLVLESKDDMKARGLASPDDGDALAMTWACYVPPKLSVGDRNRRKLETEFDPYIS